MDENPIARIPQYLNLQELICSYCVDNESGDPILYYIANISKLNCSGNSINELHESATFITNLSNFLGLIDLKCEECDFQILPDLPNLRRLDCNSNQLITLPTFPNLQILDCSGNLLNTIP
jgi:Leucine-rich repeat (LRR) protein